MQRRPRASCVLDLQQDLNVYAYACSAHVHGVVVLQVNIPLASSGAPALRQSSRYQLQSCGVGVVPHFAFFLRIPRFAQKLAKGQML